MPTYPSLIENWVGWAAPNDNRSVLHDGPSVEFTIAPIYAFRFVHAVFYIPLAVVWWPYCWVLPCVRGSNEHLGLVVQRTSMILAFASCWDFLRTVLLTLDIDNDAY